MHLVQNQYLHLFLTKQGKDFHLRKKFFYIGALGSKKTHLNRCQRLKQAGFKEEEVNSIHGPIGINLGGKSSPEIALSITAQLVLESHKL